MRHTVWLRASVVVSLAAAMSACGGAGGGATPGTPARPKIGVTLLTEDARLLQGPRGRDCRKRPPRKNLDLVIVACEMDPAKQASQIEDFVAQHVSAILRVAVRLERDRAGTSPAPSAPNIPVFTVDIAAHGGKVVSHVASDNVQGGRLAAQTLASLIGGKGTGDHHRPSDGRVRAGPRARLRRGAEEASRHHDRRASRRPTASARRRWR